MSLRTHLIWQVQHSFYVLQFFYQFDIKYIVFIALMTILLNRATSSHTSPSLKDEKGEKSKCLLLQTIQVLLLTVHVRLLLLIQVLFPIIQCIRIFSLKINFNFYNTVLAAFSATKVYCIFRLQPSSTQQDSLTEPFFLGTRFFIVEFGVGRQMGLILSVQTTLGSKLNRAMSFSKVTLLKSSWITIL